MTKKTKPRRYTSKACILPDYKIVQVVFADYFHQVITYCLEDMEKQPDVIGIKVPMEEVVWIREDNDGRPKIN